MDRYALLGSQFDCECGRRHDVPVRRFVIESGAIESLPEVLARLDMGDRACVIADPTTYEVAGRRVAQLIEGAGIGVRTRVLPEHVKTSESSIHAAREGLAPCSYLVSCGSGTVTDIVKAVATDVGVPFIAVATAPSMNGYASNVVALLREGVKVTRPARPARAVIADVHILAGAPIAMIRAGLGDVLAKPVCNADWKLAHLMRGEHFCGRAFELIRDLEPIYMERAAAIGARDHDAVALLAEALLFSGISMVLAGSSAPASGGEHLISHALDMRATTMGRESDLHGAQVGVATLMTTRIYERLLALTAGDVRRMIDDGGAGPSHEVVEREVHAFFGASAASIIRSYGEKRLEGEKRRADRSRIADTWDEMRDAVAGYLMPSSRIERCLAEAGCKRTFGELGLNHDEFMRAAVIARAIRPRYTVLDIAWELGVLTDILQEVL